VGYQAGYSQTSGGANGTFLGYQAGYSSTSSSNCCVGLPPNSNVAFSTFILFYLF
jgi:hypothetical protein